MESGGIGIGDRYSGAERHLPSLDVVLREDRYALLAVRSVAGSVEKPECSEVVYVRHFMQLLRIWSGAGKESRREEQLMLIVEKLPINGRLYSIHILMHLGIIALPYHENLKGILEL